VRRGAFSALGNYILARWPELVVAVPSPFAVISVRLSNLAAVLHRIPVRDGRLIPGPACPSLSVACSTLARGKRCPRQEHGAMQTTTIQSWRLDGFVQAALDALATQNHVNVWRQSTPETEKTVRAASLHLCALAFELHKVGKAEELDKRSSDERSHVFAGQLLKLAVRAWPYQRRYMGLRADVTPDATAAWHSLQMHLTEYFLGDPVAKAVVRDAFSTLCKVALKGPDAQAATQDGMPLGASGLPLDKAGAGGGELAGATHRQVGADQAEAVENPSDTSAGLGARLGEQVDPLSPLTYDILDALRALKATDAEKRKPASVIAEKVGGGATEQSCKGPLADLKRRGLVASKTGRHGGSWLTSEGLAAINHLRKQ
jgi:hypothetical protein